MTTTTTTAGLLRLVDADEALAHPFWRKTVPVSPLSPALLAVRQPEPPHEDSLASDVTRENKRESKGRVAREPARDARQQEQEHEEREEEEAGGRVAP